MATSLTITYQNLNNDNQQIQQCYDQSVWDVLNYLYHRFYQFNINPKTLKQLQSELETSGLMSWIEQITSAEQIVSLTLQNGDDDYFLSLKANDLLEAYLRDHKINYGKENNPNDPLSHTLHLWCHFEHQQDLKIWSPLKQILQTNPDNQYQFYNQWGIKTTLSKIVAIDFKRYQYIINSSIKEVEPIDRSLKCLEPLANLSDNQIQVLETLQPLFEANRLQKFKQWLTKHRKEYPQLCRDLEFNWPKSIIAIGNQLNANYQDFPHHVKIIETIFNQLDPKSKKIEISHLAEAYNQVFKTINIDHQTYVQKLNNQIPIYVPLVADENRIHDQMNFWNDVKKLLINLKIHLKEKGLNDLKVFELTKNNYKELCDQIKNNSDNKAFKAHHYLVYNNAIFDCKSRLNQDWSIDEAIILEQNYQKLAKQLEQKEIYLIHTMARNYYQFDPHNSSHQAAKARVDQFLNEVFSKNQTEIDIYFEFIGYGNLPNTDLRKALIIKGEGKNGKSTLINLTKEFLNPDTISNLQLTRLGEEFAKISLQHKCLNFDTEGPTYLDQGIEDLKAIIGGDELNSNVKFQNQRVWRSTTTMVIATNNEILFKNYSPAIGDRLFFIELKNRFDKDDEKINASLLSQIYGEVEDEESTTAINREATIAYFDYLLLNGIKRVINNQHQPSFHKEHIKMLNRFETNSNQVLIWLQEESYFDFIIINNKRYMTYSDSFINLIWRQSVRQIYQDYKNWHQENNSQGQPYGIKSFKNVMEQYCPLVVEKQADENNKKIEWFVIDENKWVIKTGTPFVAKGSTDEK